ncbi:MAG: DUF445 family protein [Planctomycetota bacterium]|nr:MAG: DUF445 family protein [Planctomycetota bacterium]
MAERAREVPASTAAGQAGDRPTLRFSEYVARWRARIRTHPETGLPLRPRRPRRDPGAVTLERLAFRSGKGLRWALRLFNPVCFSLFVLSFFWDWHGVVRSCSIAGIIGFSTNWVAIKMLFWPRESRPIFGQGLIPSQREEIIQKVADEVCEKLINEEIIRRELDESRLIPRLTEETTAELRRIVRDPEFVADTKQVLLAYAAELTRSPAFRAELLARIEQRVSSYAGGSMAGWLVGRLRGVWREPLLRIANEELDRLPQTVDELSQDADALLARVPAELEARLDVLDAALTRWLMALVREMDVPAIILKQLSTVTTEQLEQGFRDFADDKLGFITLLGGILGLLGGFVIVWPIESLVVIVALGGLLAALDVLLHALLGRRSAAAETSRAEEEP